MGTFIPLCDITITEVPMELTRATIEELCEHCQAWKKDFFWLYLPPDNLKLIQTYAVKQDLGLGDLVY